MHKKHHLYCIPAKILILNAITMKQSENVFTIDTIILTDNTNYMSLYWRLMLVSEKNKSGGGGRERVTFRLKE